MNRSACRLSLEFISGIEALTLLWSPVDGSSRELRDCGTFGSCCTLELWPDDTPLLCYDWSNVVWPKVWLICLGSESSTSLAVKLSLGFGLDSRKSSPLFRRILSLSLFKLFGPMLWSSCSYFFGVGVELSSRCSLRSGLWSPSSMMGCSQVWMMPIWVCRWWVLVFRLF